MFDNSKVTDHHAIIPTGIPPRALTDAEQHVFDLIARRFIAAFYPDCKYSTTTVLGEVAGEERGQEAGGKETSAKRLSTNGAQEEDAKNNEKAISFKATGKEILEPGWHVVYNQDNQNNQNNQSTPTTSDDSPENTDEGEKTLPTFVKGESGDHKPTLTEKMTTPPPYYTEATLLRAMETAGKFVEDEELRAALKENGIGRPSTRAAIIETLFRRHYIRKERKRLVATPTGIELIDVIKEELLKSCELTGIWEKKLRDIEHQKYDPAQFINELKQQITEIVGKVLADNSSRRVAIVEEESKKKKGKEKK